MPNQVRTWEENYALLVAYKESNGDCMVPLRYQTDKILGKWVSTQRESRYVLKPDRKELLDAIGFEWNPRQRRSDDKWNKMYERLLVYRESHELSTVFTANSKSSSNNKGKGSGNPDPELVKWCCNQREYSGRGLLNEERYNKLRDIGFPVRAIQKSVQAKREQDQHTDQGAETASTSPSGTSTPSSSKQQQQSNKKKRKKTNKNLQIPSLSPTLSASSPSRLSPMMVQSNGSSNKPGDASCSPTDMLSSPSTVVAPPGTSGSSSVRRRSWLESFAALQDFKEQFGHCRVPIQYKQDKQLGIWVGEQKKKKFLMSQERREKLEELGFTWANPRDKQWSTMYEKLVLYRQEHPQNNGTKPKNFNLRKWLEAQRHAILEGSLSQDCVQKLRAIGYDYSGSDNRGRRTSMDSSESLEAAETSSEAASSTGEGEDSSSSHHEEDPHFMTTTDASASVSLLLPTKRQVSLVDDEDEDDEGQASNNSNSGTIAAAPMGAVESLLSLSAPNQKKPNDESTTSSSSDVMVVGPPKKRPRTASLIIEQHLLPPPPQELAVPVPKAASLATQHFHHGNLNMAVEAAAAGTSAMPLLSHQRLATNNAASTMSNTSKNHAAPIDQLLALQQQQQQQGHRHLLGSNNDRHVVMQLQQQQNTLQLQQQQQAAATNAAPPTHAELEQLKLADLYLTTVKQLDSYRR